MAPAFVYMEVSEYPPQPPPLYSVYVDFFFGWYNEVMNQILTQDYAIPHLTVLVRSVSVQRTFFPLLIRYLFVLSVKHPLPIMQSPLVDRTLSVICLLHMRYSCV